MKYALISAHHFRSETEKPEQELVISGLYQWGQAFKQYDEGGDYLYIPDLQGYEIEQFDLIHLNMTVNNQTILSEIRDRIGWSSPSKLVCNVDISPEMWQSAYGRLPLGLLREIDKADMLFSVEPVGADILSMSLARPVHVIPHPVPVERIRADYMRYDRNGALAVIFHRYTGGNWLVPYLALRGLDLPKWLLGWVGGDVGDKPDLLYNEVISRLEFDAMMEMLSKFSMGMDLFQYYAYGRFPVECGALGIPCVTSDRIAAAGVVHPSLGVNPMDARKVRDLVIHLLSDIAFWEKCANEAWQGAEEYSLERSHERMVAAVEGEDVARRRLQYQQRSLSAELLPKAQAPPPWEFDSAFRRNGRKRALMGKSRWTPPGQIARKTDEAMRWCLAHGYSSCYRLNGKVYLPPLGELSQHVLTKIPEGVKGGKILEAGCFQGILGITLAFSHGYSDVTGLDISEAGVERANRNLECMRPYISEATKIQFDVGDVEDPPYAAGSFDVVICMETLEHAVRPERAMKKLGALVKGGGRLIVTVPDRNLVESPYHINYFFLEADPELPFELPERRHNLEKLMRTVGGDLEVETFGGYLVAALVKN